MLNDECITSQPQYSSKFQNLIERFPFTFSTSLRLGAAKLLTLFFLRKYFFIFFEKIFSSLAITRKTLASLAISFSHLLKKREGKDTKSFAFIQVFFAVIVKNSLPA